VDYSDQERDQTLKELKDKRVEVQRYKGLGEMNSETVMGNYNESSDQNAIAGERGRRRQIRPDFQVLMGDEVAPRKAFITANAQYVKNLDI